MVREKRKLTKDQRLASIIDSPAFDRLRQAMGNKEFMRFAKEKIIPVQGDLIIEGLGFSPEDLDMILNNAHVIINCAASVSFNDPIHDALNINYFGCLRMLDLAQRTKNIQAFCHVSTAYVNSNLPKDSVIDEVILNKDQEVERIVSQLMQMNPKEAEMKIDQILDGYPNTYTFTKALAERSINKKRGTLPCCIVRPTMVGSALREPFPGWCDVVQAMAAPMFFAGIGIYRFMIGTGDESPDVVPVDYTCN